jgi:hypothetical protein
MSSILSYTVNIMPSSLVLNVSSRSFRETFGKLIFDRCQQFKLTVLQCLRASNYVVCIFIEKKISAN